MNHLFGSWACRRVVAVVALTLALAVSTIGTASATPAHAPPPDRPPAVAAAPAVTITVAASSGPRTIVLGPRATKKIIGALGALTTGGAVTTCLFLVPGDFKPYCGLIINALAAMGSIGDAGEKCLSITVTAGVPPVRVSLVPCPVPAAPELVPDVPVIPQVPVVPQVPLIPQLAPVAL